MSIPSKAATKVITSKSISPSTRPTTNMKITPRRSSARGHANHGWLDSHHTFSFAQYHSPQFQQFGSLRVLNEDRVAPRSGFPTHPHRDAEIFSYVLSGELTHRDSMHAHATDGDDDDGKRGGTDDFYRMRRGDVQFTTGGSGIAHSEQNESPSAPVHFLQIWPLPWKEGLPPRYHTRSVPESSKRDRFAAIISPLKAGPGASAREEKDAVAAIEGTIPIHADFYMGAGILGPGVGAGWRVGGGGGGEKGEGVARKVYLHLPMRGVGARVRVGGGDVVLEEGDGAFVEGVKGGEEVLVESVGEGEAEVVVLDSK